MGTEDIRVCMVGAGAFSTRRIYPYIGPAAGDLVGICTRSLESSSQNARRYGGRQYTDIDTMLDAEKPDCVVVCVGPAAHPELATRIMNIRVPGSHGETAVSKLRRLDTNGSGLPGYR